MAKTAATHGGNVFQRGGAIVKLRTYINITHVLPMFTRNLLNPPPYGHVFQRTGTILLYKKTSQSPGGHLYDLRTNVPAKFHKNWTKNVTSTVLTRSDINRRHWVNIDNARRTKSDKISSQGKVEIHLGDARYVKPLQVRGLTTPGSELDALHSLNEPSQLAEWEIKLLTKFGEDRMKTT
ncbi:hypothetical protein DPMN_182469 [Dreissena polymorpha]|uniref:Uncharacterized protein n=1 Tax=Dreissena polymorpha TaxID=45954 RepID=A0A9D4I665_DREPO|nr:hypothetical protein DPMN_182469 [Dreissena polymorpha]